MHKAKNLIERNRVWVLYKKGIHDKNQNKVNIMIIVRCLFLANIQKVNQNKSFSAIPIFEFIAAREDF
jgi:hypothetical protein